MINKVALSEAMRSLQESGKEFKTLFEHGTLSLELYKPDMVDKQNPHEKDEVYIIASGESDFLLKGEVTRVQTGDFLFVPAGADHKFIDFSNDFAAWVLFYGPINGEKETLKNWV